MSAVQTTCTFKTKCPREAWYFGATSVSKQVERRVGKTRCPGCGGRFRLRAIYCNGPDELVGFQIPDHNVRVMRAKGSRRKTSSNGRGR